MSKKERKHIEAMISDVRSTLVRVENGIIYSTDADRVNAISALKRRIHNLEALLK